LRRRGRSKRAEVRREANRQQDFASRQEVLAAHGLLLFTPTDDANSAPARAEERSSYA
jgi:hypothetical protein